MLYQFCSSYEINVIHVAFLIICEYKFCDFTLIRHLKVHQSESIYILICLFHLQTREELREALENEIRSFTVDKVSHVTHM